MMRRNEVWIDNRGNGPSYRARRLVLPRKEGLSIYGFDALQQSKGGQLSISPPAMEMEGGPLLRQ
jgi:hypothetical protein